jgi:hypothetical protein
MLVTSQKLREMGCSNVIGIPYSLWMVNSGVAKAGCLRYESLEEMVQTQWFQDALAGAWLAVADVGWDGERPRGFEELVVVRMFYFDDWEPDWSSKITELVATDEEIGDESGI